MYMLYINQKIIELIHFYLYTVLFSSNECLRKTINLKRNISQNICQKENNEGLL